MTDTFAPSFGPVPKLYFIGVVVFFPAQYCRAHHHSPRSVSERT